LVRSRSGGGKNSVDIGPLSDVALMPALRGRSMKNPPLGDNDMLSEIDFGKGLRGLHHIPP
jgi:hypothetical protein